jgi:hypothetical protein
VRFTPLDNLATEVLGLNYGEHMDFCRSIGADPARVWNWARGRW